MDRICFSLRAYVVMKSDFFFFFFEQQPHSASGFNLCEAFAREKKERQKERKKEKEKAAIQKTASPPHAPVRAQCGKRRQGVLLPTCGLVASQRGLVPSPLPSDSHSAKGLVGERGACACSLAPGNRILSALRNPFFFFSLSSFAPHTLTLPRDPIAAGATAVLSVGSRWYENDYQSRIVDDTCCKRCSTLRSLTVSHLTCYSIQARSSLVISHGSCMPAPGSWWFSQPFCWAHAILLSSPRPIKCQDDTGPPSPSFKYRVPTQTHWLLST